MLGFEDIDEEMVTQDEGICNVEVENNIKLEKGVDAKFEETPKLEINHDNEKELKDMRTIHLEALIQPLEP